jgi:hypothetical protein
MFQITPCLYRNFPTVHRLVVHLENEQTVSYDAHEDMAEVVEQQQRTPLTQWMAYNASNTTAAPLTYVLFPEKFRWDAQSSQWQSRVRPGHNAHIGRVYWVSPNAGEKYFLRVLLHHVEGPKSFADLRTVDGVLCPTYREACVQRGLLQDDREWRECLREAASSQTGLQMRCLFCIILEYNSPEDPWALWTEFKEAFMEDKLYEAKMAVGRDNAIMPSMQQLENAAAWDVEQMLNQQGRDQVPTPMAFFFLPHKYTRICHWGGKLWQVTNVVTSISVEHVFPKPMIPNSSDKCNCITLID